MGYSKDVLKNIGSEPRFALKSYAQLRNIVLSLKDAQPAAEGAAPHLVDYTEKLASALRERMKGEYSGRLQKRLEQIKWPSKDLHLPGDLTSQWRDDAELLLDLQTPYGLPSLLPRVCSNFRLTRELHAHEVSSGGQNIDPPILFPLEVMVHPLELRFKYHFSGDKPTNRLDKVLCTPSGKTELLSNRRV